MRHGQSKANARGIIVSRIENDRRGDYGLSELGRQQVVAAARGCGLPDNTVSSRDPAVLTEFGHLVETFAVEQILKQVSWSDEAVTAAYFRTQAGTRSILSWRPGTAASRGSR